MATRDLSVLRDRVRSRLSDLDMTPAEAARRGGLAKDFIYDLLNDRKKTVRFDSIEKLARALDCDWMFLNGDQSEVSVVDNIVDFDRPPVDIVGEVATGVWLDTDYGYSRRINAPDMPNLPPDTRFPSEGQIDLYVKGDSINRFAPSGFILRCVLIDFWPELFRDGDMLIVDRFQGNLRERAAWRFGPTEKYMELSTDSSLRKEQISWRASVKQADGEYLSAEDQVKYKIVDQSTYQFVAIVIFAYAEPRIRRMF